MSAPTDPHAVVYHLPSARQKALLIPGGIGLMVITGLLYAAFSGTDTAALLPIAVALVVITLLAWMSATKAITGRYLAISPNGIEHHAVGMTVYAHWADCARVGEYIYKTPRTTTTYDGIYLREEAHNIWEWFIPLSDFVQDGEWRSHEIGTRVRQYAPHLFERN